MKRKSLMKIALLLCLIFIFAFATVSCGDDKNGDTTTGDNTGTETEAETQLQSTVEKTDLGGRTITFMTYRLATIDYSSSIDLIPEDTESTAVDDAIVKRNSAVIDKFNVELDYFDVDTDSQIQYLSQLMLAGDTTIDICISSMASSTALGIEGLLTPINDVPYVDLTQPWWYPNVMAETSIHGHTFFAIGDFNWHSWDVTFSMYFNKNLVEDFNINDMIQEKWGVKNLYELASSGRWTYDKFFEIASSIYVDNGNSEYDEFDTFGFSTCCDSVEAFLAGVRISFISKDSEDTPTLSVPEKFYTFFPLFNEFLNSNSTFFTDRPQYLARWGEAEYSVFHEGRALFYVNTLYSATRGLRDMKDNFGILPMPKYDESQEHYSTYNHFINNTCLTVPAQVSDLNATGMIIEDLGYFSYLYMKDAYFEKTLDGKLAIDPEDEDMLDILLSNYQFDLTNYFYYNGLQLNYKELRLAVRNNNTAIASTIGKYTKIYTSALNDIVDNVDKHYS